MKVLIISGHGAGDSGAVGNGYKEADLTRELGDLVESRLKKYCTVGRYPESRNAYADVQSGVFFNHVPGGIKSYDYVFEIHFNAGGGTGTEIYITSAESGYSVESAIVKKIAGLGVKNRGVKRTDFSVIATCKNYGVSSALLETLFIDSASDMKFWASNKTKIADAVVAGIAEEFGLKAQSYGSGSNSSSGSSSSSSNSETYKLVTSCKAYNTAADAKNRKNATATYGAGTYYVYNKADGMINVTQKKGTPGGWINPADNKKSSGSSSSSSKKKSVSEIAKEVIAGKWGTGNTRKKKLEAAGYNYEAVQAEVNRQLGVSTSKKKTVTAQVVSDVINGKYGNGDARKKNLESAGYDYDEVQAAVNKKLS